MGYTSMLPFYYKSLLCCNLWNYAIAFIAVAIIGFVCAISALKFERVWETVKVFKEMDKTIFFSESDVVYAFINYSQQEENLFSIFCGMISYVSLIV